MVDPAPAPKKSKRIVELDALRALAAINLLLFHFTFVYQQKFGFIQSPGFAYPYGKYGVQLFFMLSGLVNAMTLLSKRRASDFLAARIIRICPPFWTVMALNAVLVLMMPLVMHPVSAGQWLANLTIVPNLLGYECIEPVTWTLQVELLFYLVLLSLFMFGALDRPLSTAMWLMAVVVAVVGPVKWQILPADSTTYAWYAGLSHVLILSDLPLFFIGILINEIRCRRGNAAWHWFGIVVCGLIFHLVDTHGFNPAATVLLTAVLTLSAMGKMPVLRFRIFAYLSGISYSLYLIHNNLGTTLIYHLEPWIGVWPTLAAATLLVFVIATISTHYFELPLARRMRSQWDRIKPALARRTSAWRQSLQAAAAGKNNQIETRSNG